MGTRYQGTKTEIRALDAYIKLRRAVNAISVCEARVMRGANLTESQFGVLEALEHLGPMCQRELADKILKSAGNLTTVIDNLERRRLVQRERDRDDRRVVTVCLTPGGRKLIRAVLPEHVEALAGAFSVLTSNQQDQLAGLCVKLGKHSST